MQPIFEAIEIEANSSIRTLHYECDRFQDDHSWHYHPEYEISLVLHGSGTRFIGDSIENFNSGDLVLLGPNIPHCWTSEPNSSTQHNEVVVIQFSDNCLGDTFTQIPEAKKLSKLLDRAKRGISFAPKNTTIIQQKMHSICNKKNLALIACLLDVFELLTQEKNFKYIISEHYTMDDHAFHGKRMKIIMGYILDNLCYEIKQTELAHLLDITPQSFSRFFKQATGRTFVSFVNVMRIAKACQLLAHTNEDILNISLNCGYSNLSNFNRRFSELKNTTPSQYRNYYQKLHN